MFCGKSFVIIIYFFAISFFGVLLKYTFLISDLFCFFGSVEEVHIYDYIIVGSGSAGSVIANRLANNKNKKILVLEAGRYDPELLHIPSVGLLLQQTPFDWSFKTVPQKNSCLALNQNVSTWPMGKVLGGTSMLNNMLYVRGHQYDFDEWFKNKQYYDYSDILSHFRKVESNMVSEDGDVEGTEQSVYISDLIFTTTLPTVMLKAAKSLGYPVMDHNMDCHIGFSSPKANLHNGKRWTSADKLKLNQNPNLHIKLNRLAYKVLFKANYEAYGVKYISCGKHYTARAKSGVILSAGVIGTPKILMLSGIGRKDHLEKLGIKTVLDLPVGDNLQDHVTTGFGLILLNKTLELGIERMLSVFSVLEYFIKGSGPWTTTGCELIAFLNTKDRSLENNTRPNLQLMAMPLGITEDNGVHLRKLIGISDSIWADYFTKIQHPTMTILPVLLHPKSRGTVRLASRDPLAKPLIDPQYLTDPEDVNTLIDGIEIIKNLLNTKEFASLGAEFNTSPFPACDNILFDSKEYWECYIRHFTITSYHPIGTCKMGPFDDQTSVVDFNFKVKGTNKLFVVDGSVLPSLTSGNINAAILMIAEMASDVLKKTNYLESKRCTIYDLLLFSSVC